MALLPGVPPPYANGICFVQVNQKPTGSLKMRCTVLLSALLCSLASASAVGRDAPTLSGRALLQQTPNCSRIMNCEQCFNAKNDDAVTVLLCRVCSKGYKPTAESDQCGKCGQS